MFVKGASYKPVVRLLLLLGLVGCGRTNATLTASPVPLPTLLPTASLDPAIPPSLPLDTDWHVVAPGTELRRMRVDVNGELAPLSIVRLDHNLVHFRVGYDPIRQPTLGEWARQEAALAVINGGFFDSEGRTVALLVRDSQAVGSSYVGRGGMFVVAPDGTVSLRALSDQPYDPSEPIREALQGWPTLVRTAGEATYTFEDGQRSRRSVLALDQAGRVLLIAAPTAAFTLAELSNWLAHSDLNIATAINLDGGSSTGLWLSAPGAVERIDPFVGLPIVLIVTPR